MPSAPTYPILSPFAHAQPFLFPTKMVDDAFANSSIPVKVTETLKILCSFFPHLFPESPPEYNCYAGKARVKQTTDNLSDGKTWNLSGGGSAQVIAKL